MNHAIRRGMRCVHWLVLLMLAICAALFPMAAFAHPLGNFTVNRYSRLELTPASVQVVYVIDMAEIPTFQLRQQIDTNTDATVDAVELAAFKPDFVTQIAANLQLRSADQPLPFILDDSTITFPTGQGGLPTMRLEARLHADIALKDAQQFVYHDTNFAGRIGWSEVVVVPNNAVSVRDSSVPAQDLSNALRTYPADLLRTPPAVTSATFTLVPAVETTHIDTQVIHNTYQQVDKPVDNFAALITQPIHDPLGLLLVLFAAAGLGAAHALAPGHGKSIAAAYLVGTRGTAWHAAFLGLTTTITHTAGVFVLGFVTLLVAQFILPEQLYPWLNVISSVLVLLLGIGLLRNRLHNWRQESAHGHSHGLGGFHSHTPEELQTHRMATRNLLLLGISGGLVPCPSALVVLLGAVAIGQIGLGLLLVVSFSLGLAIVLTAIGLLLVYARKLFEKIPSRGSMLRALPLISAVVVLVVGLGMTTTALLAVTHG